MARKVKKRKKRKEVREEVVEGAGGVDEQLDELFEENWPRIEPKSFEELPDATYQARLLAAVINNAQTSGRLQCSWESLVLEGEYKGRHIFIHQGLDTEDGIAYFKGSLARLGYDVPESKKELIKLLGEIVEAPTYVMIRLSTRKRRIEGKIQEIQNKRFIKALDSDEVDDDFKEEELSPTMGAVSAEEEAGEGEGTWEKGDRVRAKLDGEYYEGKITKIGEDTAAVTFDDGDKMDIDLGDLEEVAATAEETAEEAKDGEEPSCELKKKKFTPAERRTVNKLAKKDKFDPDDYDTTADLLCDLGDYHGLSGKFKDVTTLMKALEKVIESE